VTIHKRYSCSLFFASSFFGRFPIKCQPLFMYVSLLVVWQTDGFVKTTSHCICLDPFNHPATEEHGITQPYSGRYQNPRFPCPSGPGPLDYCDRPLIDPILFSGMWTWPSVARSGGWQSDIPTRSSRHCGKYGGNRILEIKHNKFRTINEHDCVCARQVHWLKFACPLYLQSISGPPFQQITAFLTQVQFILL
jgi:hypothetical protein